MTGFFISTEKKIVARCSVYRCQCPMTGFFISTKNDKRKQDKWNGVSMPYDGLFHFYIMKKLYRVVYFECQCPMTGFFISTEPWSRARTIRRPVSMPYDGLFHFYLYRTRTSKSSARTGVNALWRAFSFLRCIPSTGIWAMSACVNALWRAFSFLPRRKKCWFMYYICVNALWRAFSFLQNTAENSLGTRSIVSMPYDGLFHFYAFYVRKL